MQLAFSRWWCAEYLDGDPLGQILASVALLPYFVILHVASRCYSRRDVHDFFVFAGLIANEALAKALKQAIKHPRPTERCALLDTCDSFGMPSSHTQCMFFAAALHAFLLSRHFGRSSWPTAIMGLLELAAAILGAVAVAYSRVYLTYHSVDQTVAGAVIGAAFGVTWGVLLGALSPLYPALSQSVLGRLLHLKDSWGVPEPLEVERKAIAQASSNQKQKKK